MDYCLTLDTPFLRLNSWLVRFAKQNLHLNKMRQTRLPIDWIIEAEESSSSSGEQEVEVKRGRKEYPLQWTRVKSLRLIKEQKLMVYDGTKDL